MVPTKFHLGYYYGLVEPANILIQNIPQYYNQSSPTYNTRLGEAYFFRAYAYFELVKTIWWCTFEISSVYKCRNIFHTEFC